MCVALLWLQTSGLYLLHSYYHVVFADLYPLGHATQSTGMFFLSIILWKKIMRYTIVIYQIRGLLLKTWRIWTWSTYLEQRYKYMTKIAKRSATERPSVIQMHCPVDLLQTSGMLFQDQDDLVEGEILWIRGYPKAFLHHIRNIQADRALAAFRDVLTRINQHCYSDDTSMS